MGPFPSSRQGWNAHARGALRGWLPQRSPSDDPATGCTFSSLGTEAARGSADLRRALTESTRSQIDRFSAEAKGGTPRDKRREGIAAWSAMVGAMVLARIVDDDNLSREILSETRASMPIA